MVGKHNRKIKACRIKINPIVEQFLRKIIKQVGVRRAARITGIPRTTLQAWAKKWGVSSPSHVRSRLYLLGNTLADILRNNSIRAAAKILNVSLSTVKYWRRKLGIFKKVDLPSITLNEDLAFLLGVWSADGSISIDKVRHIYRFEITLSAKEMDIARIYMDVANKLGFGFRLRYLNREKTAIRLTINSKHVVECLLRAGAVLGKKTETNPSIPQWIRNKPEYMKNWLWGVILGDGDICPDNCYIDWYRTLEIPKGTEVWKKLANLIAKHPRSQYYPHINGFKLAQSYIPRDLDRVIKQHYVPRMLNEEYDILSKLGIIARKRYRASYYVGTRNVTVTWRLYVHGDNAIKLARFLRPSKMPWLAKKIEALRKIEKLRI